MLSRITFGTSGARGLTNVEITPAHALAVGTLYAQSRMNLVPTAGSGMARLVVAHDQRHGARMLAESVMAGIHSAGAQAIDLGQTPTPVALTWLAGHAPLGGAILVTGSHMGPDRIGLIPINPDGTYCRKDLTGPMEDAIPSFFETARRGAPFSQITTPVRISPEERDKFYLAKALAGVDADTVRTRGFRVLIDPGNATATGVSTELLFRLGCQVTVVNGETRPIPNRPSEVRAVNCPDAVRRTAEDGLDLGACFDGDADRVLFIAQDGMALSEDVVAAIFASHVLKTGDVCVATINSSGLMAHVCQQAGAELVYCRIGQPDTGRAVLEHNAAFASEPAAKYWFGRQFNWYDGPFAVAKMLEIMAMRQMTLAQLAAELPPYYQASANIPLEDARKAEVCARAVEQIRERLGLEIEREDTLDGVRFTLKDGSWLMVRPSGTEPLCRIYSDSADRSKADALTAMAREIMEDDFCCGER